MGRSRWASEARSVSSNPLPAAACGDYEEIIVRGVAEIRNPPPPNKADEQNILLTI